ncbi:MAG: SDR family NAD(P)-dependent oxidoreductase [Dehalococcoidia bacterium]|nr:SDR family NAD(P)-dependent oxidoreductase [Dehalococcoidia bacterium]
MRVLVTGGTGFVGSHTVAALARAGHDVRLLVRDPARVAPAFAPHGIDAPEAVRGDVTDRASVEAALQGCDAVVHAASIYSLDNRRAREVRETNRTGTRNVLEAATAAQLDPVVHVSSYIALVPGRGPASASSPVTGTIGPYAASKAESERFARQLQERGLPVVTVLPGSVWGPDDPYFGESHQIASNFLRGRMRLVNRGGSFPLVDVRDVAEATARAVQPGRGPRGYLLAGQLTSSVELATLLIRLTGHRIRYATLPDTLVRGSAPVVDLGQRISPWRLPLNGETMRFVTQPHREMDHAAAVADLGFAMRPLEDTLTDTVRSLLRAGHITSAQAGKLAD